MLGWRSCGTLAREAAILKALLLSIPPSPCSPGSTLISCVLAPSLPRHDLTPSHPWRPQKRDCCFLPHTRTWRPTRPLSLGWGRLASLQRRHGRLSVPHAPQPLLTQHPLLHLSHKLFASKPYLSPFVLFCCWEGYAVGILGRRALLGVFPPSHPGVLCNFCSAGR